MEIHNFYQVTEKDIFENLINLRQLTFEVTDACNLKCKYCGFGELYHGYDDRESKFMSLPNAKAIIDYLVEIWKNHKQKGLKQLVYVSFYGGEPLMNMKLIQEIIDYIEKSTNEIDKKIIFSMTTNALLLDKYMNYLKEKNVRLLISLDGDEQSNSYRVNHLGKTSFSKVFKNINLLQKTYPEYFKSEVNFNSVLHNRNTVKGIHDFIKKEYDKTGTIGELNNSGINPEKINEFNEIFQNMTESLHMSNNYEELSKEILVNDPEIHDLLIFLNKYSNNTFRDYRELLINSDDLTVFPTGTCTPFSKKMFVTVTGKIIQCERIDHNFNVGQIIGDKVVMNLNDVAEFFNNRISKLYSQCSTCYGKQSCTQCIYYLENIEGREPICHGYMDEKKFKQYTFNKLCYLAKYPYLYKKLMEDVIVS